MATRGSLSTQAESQKHFPFSAIRFHPLQTPAASQVLEEQPPRLQLPDTLVPTAILPRIYPYPDGT
jgi:hypothetical protein